MKFFNKYLAKSVFAMVLLLVAGSCTLTDLKVEDNPNALREDQIDLDLLINAIERNLSLVFEAGTNFGMDVTRMKHMNGPLYSNAYRPQNFDTFWLRSYASVLINCNRAISMADTKKSYRESGIARIIKSYVFMVLVDMFADVPYTEALQGLKNTNPKATSGEEVYKGSIKELETAIKNLKKGSPLDAPEDRANFYFGTNYDRWVTVANTLLMRAYLNTGNASGFKKILAGGDYMGANGKSFDWSFKFGEINSNPDVRHPKFATNYVKGGTQYMSNSFMNLMRITNDPRTAYYFYRQTTKSATKSNELACLTSSKPSHYGSQDVFCKLSSGYWGRDHGNADGVPPDRYKRTIWGVYPVGGKYDNNKGGRGRATSGALGKGISPLMMSFYVDFMRAEAALTLKTGENAETLLIKAVENSIKAVMDFPASVGYSLEGQTLPTVADVSTYVNNVKTAYTGAASDEKKLEVISIEFYKALFGNGYEVYNLYRRTGYPANMQPTLEKNPGGFMYSFFYPSNFVNRNGSVNQKGLNVRPFWDKKKLKLK